MVDQEIIDLGTKAKAAKDRRLAKEAQYEKLARAFVPVLFQGVLDGHEGYIQARMVGDGPPMVQWQDAGYEYEWKFSVEYLANSQWGGRFADVPADSLKIWRIGTSSVGGLDGKTLNRVMRELWKDWKDRLDAYVLQFCYCSNRSCASPCLAGAGARAAGWGD